MTSGNEALKCNLQLIRRAGFCDTFDWRRTGIPRLCISPNCILFVRLDRYINIKTRRKCHYCVDIWVRAVMECSASLSLMTTIRREYVNRLFYHATSADAAPDEIPQWATKLTASLAIAVVTVICAASPKLATRVAVLFTSVKVRL